MTADLAERYSVIDRVLENTEASLRLPEVVSQVGDEQIARLQNLLGTLCVPNMVDGIASLTQDQLEQPDAVPIVALKAGESWRLDDHFATSTETQQQAFEQEVASWQPETDTTATLLWQALRPMALRQTRSAQVATKAEAVAWVCANASNFIPRAEGFTNAPAGTALMYTRPLLVLPVEQDFTPDLIAHELVHIGQYLHTPLNVYRRHDAKTMHFLRDELEAYHIGSRVFEGLLIKEYNGQLSYEAFCKLPNLSVMQSLVETYREKHNDESDPFRPSVELLRKLNQDVPNILHGFDLSHILADETPLFRLEPVTNY